MNTFRCTEATSNILVHVLVTCSNMNKNKNMNENVARGFRTDVIVIHFYEICYSTNTYYKTTCILLLTNTTKGLYEL